MSCNPVAGDVKKSVQITFLKCGGVTVGTGMHHVTIDRKSVV